MRTIAIVNQKGGCGKTTTAINLASIYAKRGLRTLLVDMDPQSHCAIGLGVPEARIEYSIGDALLADHTNGFDARTLLWEVARNLHLAPSTMMLSALEAPAPGGGLHQMPDKDRRLESLLNVIGGNFDRCLIDCPPTIGLLTFNALRAAKEALIPVETGFFALRGAEKQWNTIQKIISHIDRPIGCHLLATLHKPESKLACNILAALRRQFAGQIMPVVIHEHEELRAAASFGQPVIEYAPESLASADYSALVDWLEEHAGYSPPQIEVLTRDHVSSRTLPTVADSLLGGGSPIQPPRALELSGAASMTAARQPVGSRAAEMVRRVHDFAARTEQRAAEGSITDKPSTSINSPAAALTSSAIAGVIEAARGVVAEPQAAALSTAVLVADADTAPMVDGVEEDVERAKVDHLFGVRQISRGVLFVQPGDCGRHVCVAGDFNDWSATATPMRRNMDLGVHEAVVPLSPGRYQYRLVIDGRWLPDSHNELRQINHYGELNSMVEVR